MTLEVRPAFHIHVHTIPGSGHIKWWLADSEPRYMFKPATGEMWPYDSDANPDDVFSGIQASNLSQITRRLLHHDEQGRKFFADATCSFPSPNRPHP
jgi:hypothetical protein